MPLTVPELTGAVAELHNTRAQDQSRLNRIYRHLRDQVTGRQAGVFVPNRVTREYRMLVEQARFNILEIVVTTVAQNLFVEGFRQRAAIQNAPIWDDVWQPNRMDARQSGIWRAAITYGTSYATVFPGDPAPVITPYSPRKLTALYIDQVNDEWPEVAMVWLGARPTEHGMAQLIEVYDDQVVWTVELVEKQAPRILNAEGHGLGVVPVVRFRNRFELEESTGKVEPLIPIQQQLNQATFSLLMAQQYGAFRQRWVTGMEIEEDENGNPKRPFNIAVDTLLHAESEATKFGEFSQTDLGGYLTSRDKTLLHAASVAQIPPHNLLTGGGISNISADALEALESAHRHDVGEHQHSLGESTEQMLRLAGLAAGDIETWEDRSAQVRWADTTPRSLAQSADALGKLASQLNIPARGLWERVPGVTDGDLESWDTLAEQGDLFSNLDSILDTGGGLDDAQPTSEPADAATP